jgi:hypothetical protein
VIGYKNLPSEKTEKGNVYSIYLLIILCAYQMFYLNETQRFHTILTAGVSSISPFSVKHDLLAIGEMSGSHGAEYEDERRLGYSAM